MTNQQSSDVEKNASQGVLHMVGHGHIDPVWLWRLPEGLAEIRATFQSALDRMRETPAFHFTASSAFFYAWIEETDPAMFAEIRQRVQEGRWEIAGGWWIEPDCNLPGGESFVRQGLLGQRFFRSRFGKPAVIGFNPDSFGHCAMLPQILRKQGLRFYAYMRPSADAGGPPERAYPDGTTFSWRGPCGSEVLATNILLEYGSTTGGMICLERIPGHPALNPGQRTMLGFFGVGDHGGGPTKAHIKAIEERNAASEGIEYRMSTLEQYFTALEDEFASKPLPSIAGELQYHARGCYSAHAGIKKLARYAEHELLGAESAATADWLVNATSYPAEALRQSWQSLLFNHFHDILAGSSIEAACHDASEALGRVREDARTVYHTAVQRIARAVDTRNGANTLFVFNPLPWESCAPVEVPAYAAWRLAQPERPWQAGAPLHVVDPDGQSVAVQYNHGEYAGGQKIAFLAQLPALGYACYRLVEGSGKQTPSRALEAHEGLLENDWWRIEIDRHSGEIVRLMDKSNGVDVLERGNMFSVLSDDSDTWSHGVSSYRSEVGRFTARRVRLIEHGDVYARIALDLQYESAAIRQHVTLYREMPRIDIDLDIDWRGAFQMLKLAFETRINEPRALYETPFGATERPATGDEEPGQRWFCCAGTIDGQDYGFAVANDAKYAYDIQDGCMRMTLLRCPPYALHDPHRHDMEHGARIMDQGLQTVKIRLLPFAGDWSGAHLAQRAAELIMPPSVHCEYAHDGTMPRRMSFVSVQPDTVQLTALKQHEDGGAVLVRVVELVGMETQASIAMSFCENDYKCSLGPHEIKTMAINPKTGAVTETDLLEDPA